MKLGKLTFLDWFIFAGVAFATWNVANAVYWIGMRIVNGNVE